MTENNIELLNEDGNSTFKEKIKKIIDKIIEWINKFKDILRKIINKIKLFFINKFKGKSKIDKNEFNNKIKIPEIIKKKK